MSRKIDMLPMDDPEILLAEREIAANGRVMPTKIVEHITPAQEYEQGLTAEQSLDRRFKAVIRAKSIEECEQAAGGATFDKYLNYCGKFSSMRQKEITVNANVTAKGLFALMPVVETL